jgi:hypothetical protein
MELMQLQIQKAWWACSLLRLRVGIDWSLVPSFLYP